MKHVILAALIALGGCTATQLQQAQADISTGIQAACADVMAASALPGVDPNLKVYAGPSCATATAAAALVQNAQTVQWLGQLAGQLQASATKPAA